MGRAIVENNLLGGTESGQETLAQQHAKDVLSCADDPSSESCQRGLAANKAYAGALATGGMALLPGSAQAMWLLGAGANAGVQYADEQQVNPVNAIIAGWVNVFSMGNGLLGTVGWNATGGALTNQINGDDPLTSAITSGFGAGVGYEAGNYIVKPIVNTAGKLATGGWDPKFNPGWLNYSEVKGQLGISKQMLPSKIPGATGNVTGSLSSEYSNHEAQKIIDKVSE